MIKRYNITLDEETSNIIECLKEKLNTNRSGVIKILAHNYNEKGCKKDAQEFTIKDERSTSHNVQCVNENVYSWEEICMAQTLFKDMINQAAEDITKCCNGGSRELNRSLLCEWFKAFIRINGDIAIKYLQYKKDEEYCNRYF